MKIRTKLADRLGWKEDNMRFIQKHLDDDASLKSVISVPDINQYLDGIIEIVKPFAEKQGVSPEDMQVKIATRKFEKGMKLADGENAVIQTISTRDMDRDREIVMPKGLVLDQFLLAPHVLLGHNHASLPIGISPDIQASKKDVQAKTFFAPTDRGQETSTLVKGGFLKTASIGFIPLEIAEKGSDDFKRITHNMMRSAPEFAETAEQVNRFHLKSLLLEWSYVSVASNFNALTQQIGKGELEIGEEWLKELKADPDDSTPVEKKSAPVEIKTEPAPEPPKEKKRLIKPVRTIEPLPEKRERFVEPFHANPPDVEDSVKKSIDIQKFGRV